MSNTESSPTDATNHQERVRILCSIMCQIDSMLAKEKQRLANEKQRLVDKCYIQLKATTNAKNIELKNEEHHVVNKDTEYELLNQKACGRRHSI